MRKVEVKGGLVPVASRTPSLLYLVGEPVDPTAVLEQTLWTISEENLGKQALSPEETVFHGQWVDERVHQEDD